MKTATSSYDIWFWNKQYQFRRENNGYMLFDNRWKDCLRIKEEIGRRIHGLLNIQAMKENRFGTHHEQAYQIYKDANCHGTAIYTLGHHWESEFDRLDMDGDMFIYDERRNEQEAFEEKYTKSYNQELLNTLAMPIGIHFTKLFQRHSAVLLWEDRRNPEYYVSFQKMGYEAPRVLASWRKEILDLRNDILLMPNNYK